MELVFELGNRQDIWIGGNDKMCEMTWRWIDGTTWDEDELSPLWGFEEPNNLLEEDCLALRLLTEGHFNDYMCEIEFRYACEKEN